jgi:hypothetical protein
MTVSQPISPHQRPFVEIGNPAQSPLPSKHLELLSEDPSQANDEENLAGELRE